MSNTEGTFSDELVSVATLGLGSELAEAEEDLTVAVWPAALKEAIIVLLIEVESSADFSVKEEDCCFTKLSSCGSLLWDLALPQSKCLKF